MTFSVFGGVPEALIIVPFERDLDALGRRWRFAGKPVEFGGRSFQKAWVGGREVFITPTKAGLSETTLTCDIGLIKLRAKRVISVGLAGALSDVYEVGDAVIVQHVGCHERGSFSDDGTFIPRQSQLAEVPADVFLEQFEEELRRQISSREMSVYDDDLVSGNSFIASNGKRKWLRETFGTGLVDMNASGIMESCLALDTPFCVIRIVSDHATATAPQDFGRFSSDTERSEAFWDAFCSALSQSMEGLK